MPARHSESTPIPNSSANVKIGRSPSILAVLFDRENVTVNSPRLATAAPSAAGDEGCEPNDSVLMLCSATPN